MGHKFIFILAILFGFNVFAGNRHIYCEGNLIQADMPAKGPVPHTKEFVLRGVRPNITLREIQIIEDNNSYDFHIIYQSKDFGKNIVAVLQYTNTQMSLEVFENTELLEGNIRCKIGF